MAVARLQREGVRPQTHERGSRNAHENAVKTSSPPICRSGFLQHSREEAVGVLSGRKSAKLAGVVNKTFGVDSEREMGLERVRDF